MCPTPDSAHNGVNFSRWLHRRGSRIYIFLMDGKINETKTVTPFCIFTLCEACLCKLSLSEVFSSLVSLAVLLTGEKKRGGGGGVGELVQGRNIVKQTETPILFT